MEQDQVEKHACKLCNKSFLSGKSLGGHMRGHYATNSGKEEAEPSNSDIGLQGGYVLRENPKKSWKFSRFNHGSATTSTAMQETTCKACGKEFGSLRALFGHMRHHSGKEKKGIHCEECGKGFQSLRALTAHMRSHTKKLGVSNESRTSSSRSLVVESLIDSKTMNLVRRKRSMRYKTTPSSSFSSLNESSSVNEFEEEVEDVALCLMMLSRGIRNWGGLNFVSDSSGNNFVTFEVKSLNEKKRILNSENDFVCDGDLTFKTKRPREDSYVSDSFNGFSEKKINDCIEFDSGFACDEKKKLELGVPKMEKEIHGELKLKSIEVEPIDDFIKEIELKVAGFGSVKSSPCKDAGFDAYDTELGVNSDVKIVYSSSDSEILDNSGKKNRFRCRTCNKMFLSYQALGGHQTLHRTNKSCTESKTEKYEENLQHDILPEIEADCNLVKLQAIENSVEHEMVGVNLKGYEPRNSSKERKCPICFKVCASGQALGGHKRAHHTKNSKAREEQTEMNQEFSGICDELDLNLPAMIDEEGTDDVGVKALWVGREDKNEELEGLIAN